MKQITNIKEIQAIELEVLKRFIELCEKHHLRYYLMGGTLIGCIRHKGFIPWDDDIDLGMPRPDYERFLEITHAPYQDHYETISFRTLDRCRATNAFFYDNRTKLVFHNSLIKFEPGVFIDIFPLDGVPSNAMAQKLFFLEVFFWRALLSLATTKPYKMQNKFHKAVKIVLGPIFRRLDYKKILRYCEKINRRYSFEQSNDIAFIFGLYGQKEAMNKEQFISTVKGEFEGVKVDLPGCWDHYLNLHYGDYMELPPENKRQTHHEFDVFVT